MVNEEQSYPGNYWNQEQKNKLNEFYSTILGDDKPYLIKEVSDFWLNYSKAKVNFSTETYTEEYSILDMTDLYIRLKEYEYLDERKLVH